MFSFSYKKQLLFNNSMLKNLYIFSFILLLSSCAGLANKPEQFKINISSIQMMESSVMEQRYHIALRVMNRSQDLLKIEGMSFDIELNDKDFASGVSNEAFTLPPLSEGIINVTVTSTIFGLIRQFNAMQKLKTKPFKYELSGYIYIGSTFGIPFREKGEINLNKTL